MLKSLLPTPVHQTDTFDDEDVSNVQESTIPVYGSRRGWTPKCEADFNDGGAYPEIHIVQFPLNIGKPNNVKSSSNALIKTLDIDGNIAYSDTVASRGHNNKRIVHSKITDLIPKEITTENDPSLARPGKDEEEETAKRTQLALMGFAGEKYGSTKPIKEIQKRGAAQYIRYTPAMQGHGHNSGASQRIIRMVEAPLDPLEPPRFKTNKKIPKAAPSPPAPVLHSPPRKLSQADQVRWRIPPCISNWTNPKGYTIPLDKRLAADGRGLQETIINENFAKMSEALYIADRKAREAIEMRNSLERKMAQREKEKKEQQLRQLAQKARDERGGVGQTPGGTAAGGPPGGGGIVSYDPDSDDDEESEKSDQEQESGDEETKADLNLAKEREEMRKDKRHERQRERNLARASQATRAKIRQNEEERDVSEQIALGMPQKKKGQGEVVYDQRLFNQSSGLDSGFHREDDTYNVYTERWNETGDSRVSKSLYRPREGEGQDQFGNADEYKTAKQFVADRGFEGAVGKSTRTGPVQFEKDKDDPFGLDDFLEKTKTGDGPSSSKKPRNQ